MNTQIQNEKGLDSNPEHPEDKSGIKKWAVRALFLFVLLLIAKFVIMPKMKARQAVPPPAIARPMVVKIVHLSPQTLEFTRGYTARITDDGRTLVSARLNTTIANVYFSEGDVVKAGDILALLDTQDVRSEVSRAQASVTKIEADIDFFEKQIVIDRTLYEGGAIPKTALDDSERKLKGLRASIAQQESGLKLSRQKLGYGKIYAPVSGRVQKVHISKGEQVAPGKPVMEIVGGASYKAVIPIPERDMSNIVLGSTAYIQMPNGGSWAGTIDKIYPALDERTHTGTIDVTLDSRVSKEFFAGSMTSVRLVSEHYENVLAVPTQAIFNRSGLSGVFTMSEGTAHWKPVTLGASNGIRTIIKSGLSAGNLVITTPYPSLNEGVKVTVSNANLSQGGAL